MVLLKGNIILSGGPRKFHTNTISGDVANPQQKRVRLYCSPMDKVIVSGQYLKHFIVQNRDCFLENGKFVSALLFNASSNFTLFNILRRS